MPFTAGSRLGPYEILDFVGSGGMGHVYRAKDTRLPRVVAIKVLRDELSGRPRLRDRFEREGQAISRLSHPNICVLFDVGHQDGTDFLVMEYLDGTTLDDRLNVHGLSVSETLRYAEEIASALQEAHRIGIVHRDLKPSNVMLTRSGAKLLDFGVAKLLAEQSGRSVDTSSTTETSERTSRGAVIGTPAYMAPEQLDGQEADARSDIFALGAVLYEMLTRRRAFEGDDRSSLRQAIATTEPAAPSSIRPSCPRALDHVVLSCLAKEPEERWQSAHDVMVELRWIASEARQPPSARRLLREWHVWWPVAAAVTIAAAAVAALLLATRPELPLLLRGRPRQVTAAPGWEAEPALSPDGGLIAYASDQSGNADIWVVDAHGGNPLRLTDHPASDRDPDWFPDGTAIAFASDRGDRRAVWKVPRLGGGATLVVPDAEDPAISPDGKRIAFARSEASGEQRIWVAPLEAVSKARRLTQDGQGIWQHRHPAWSPDGSQISYEAQRDLWVIPSTGGEARRLTTDDEPDVESCWSPDGRLVYFSSYRDGSHALWRVPAGGGVPIRLSLGSGPERHPRLSRDGRRLVYSTFLDAADLVIVELATRKEARLAGFLNYSPALAPDSKAVAFVSNRLGGKWDLYVQGVSDEGLAGPARRLTEQPGTLSHPAYSPRGDWIAFYRVVAGQRDIWVMSTTGGPPLQFTDDPAADIHPAWSPDGRELAFVSERDGGSHVWVAPIAEGRPTGPARQLTSGAGTDKAPTWSPQGNQVAFIRAGDGGQSEVWVVPSDGRGAARRVTTGAGAERVRWLMTAGSLFVSGFWGSDRVELRKVDPATGRNFSLDPPIVFGQNPFFIDFDLSRDDRLVTFMRAQSRGDIWLLEATDSNF
jgi:Tol biopolymer transport system component/tRNA A-37 threonylcarbamoyl transferase component Bud32